MTLKKTILSRAEFFGNDFPRAAGLSSEFLRANNIENWKCSSIILRRMSLKRDLKNAKKNQKFIYFFFVILLDFLK